jgi:hypothetical protein
MVTSEVDGLPAPLLGRYLSGLPSADGYAIHARPLRYEDRPYLSAWTLFDSRRIILEIPDPFLPFGEVVAYGARRRTDPDSMRFVWLTEGITFGTPREVARFLYLHEWMHWYLWEVLGRKSKAETACDRFALRNYQRRTVGLSDARRALSRRRHSAEGSGEQHSRSDQAESLVMQTSLWPG